MKHISRLFAVVMAIAMVILSGCKKADANDNGVGGSTNVVPVGAVNGLFSVSDNQKVFFSQGNLQYNTTTNIWRFSEHQYDYINQNLYSNYWMDLFGWGTGNAPTNVLIEGDYSNYSEWGNNTISNGCDTIVWRTLTKEEWNYVIDVRNTNSGIRYAKAQIGEINGVVLLPDNWNDNIYTLNNSNCFDVNYDSNIVDVSDWLTKFETNGAVFLPAGGFRNNYVVGAGGEVGHYWSSTEIYNSLAWMFCFGNDFLNIAGNNRWFGYSVRLVCDVQ